MLVYPHGGGLVIFKPFVIGATNWLLDELYKFHVIGQAEIGSSVGDDSGAKLGIGLGEIGRLGDLTGAFVGALTGTLAGGWTGAVVRGLTGALVRGWTGALVRGWTGALV
jgi:hypothetical protein